MGLGQDNRSAGKSGRKEDRQTEGAVFVLVVVSLHSLCLRVATVCVCWGRKARRAYPV